MNADEGQSLSLPDGTSLEVPAGSLAFDTELVLMRSEVPDDLDEYDLITDIYFVASEERTLAAGDYTLAIPYDASLLPDGVSEQDLQAFAALDGPLVFPVPSHVDTERQMLIVENPNITVLEPSDKLTGLSFNMTPAGDQGGLSTPPQTWRLETFNRIWAYGGGVKSNAELTCTEGTTVAAGEVIQEKEHVFRIVIETPTKCEVVKDISSLLMEAFEGLNSAYGSPSGLSSSERMFVIIGDFVPSGQYLLNGSVGYFEIDRKWFEGALPEERRKVMFHEMFHYIQDAHTSSDFIHGAAEWLRGDADWWYEATAEWVGLEAAAKWMARPDTQEATTYEQAWENLMKDKLSTFPELLSVPVQESGDYNLATYNTLKKGEYYYGYALLIKHVEEVRPGYLKEAVNGWDMSSNALYNTMVEEGRLDSTYPDFVRNLMQVALPDPGFWIKSGIEETSRETVHYSRFFNADGTGEESPEWYRDDEERAGPHQLFSDSLEPLTTQFFRLQFQGVAEEPRCVNV